MTWKQLATDAAALALSKWRRSKRTLRGFAHASVGLSVMPDRVALVDQIAEIDAEILRRDDAFPREIAGKRLLAGDAARKQTRLRAVLRTLLWLQENEATIRTALYGNRVRGRQ